MRKKKTLRPTQPPRRAFSLNLATPGLSFAAALRGPTEQPKQQQQQNWREEVQCSEQLNKGQSVQAPLNTTEPMDNMLKVISIVQQIMTELGGAVSEEAKIVAITKTVLKLMKGNSN
jgi:hypothetical protein